MSTTAAEHLSELSPNSSLTNSGYFDSDDYQNQSIQVYHAGDTRRSKFHGIASDIQHVAAEDIKRLPSRAVSLSGRMFRDPHSRDDLIITISTGMDGIATDRITENQRGIFLLGFSLFSSGSLIPLYDPPPMCTTEGHKIESLEQVVPPDFTWTWTWKKWYVDMSGEVDDQGWSYSWDFRGRYWYNRHKFLRSFARKRTWMRVRRKVTTFERLEAEEPYTSSKFDVRSISSLNGSRRGSLASSLNTNDAWSGVEVDAKGESLSSVSALSIDGSNDLYKDTLRVSGGSSLSKGSSGGGKVSKFSGHPLPKISENDSSGSQFTFFDSETFLQHVKGGRLDRERIHRVIDAVETGENEGFFNQLSDEAAQKLVADILRTIIFPDSRRNLLNQLRNLYETRQSSSEATGSTSFLHLFIGYLENPSEQRSSKGYGGSNRGKEKEKMK